MSRKDQKIIPILTSRKDQNRSMDQSECESMMINLDPRMCSVEDSSKTENSDI